MEDKVNHPGHYTAQGKVECIDFVAAMVKPYPGEIAFDIGNVMKYTWRSQMKNGREDIEKASWYFKRAVSTIEKLESNPKDRRNLRKISENIRNDGRWTGEEKDVFSGGANEILKKLRPEEKTHYARILGSVMNGNLILSKEKREQARDELEKWAASYDRYREEEKQQKKKNTLRRSRITPPVETASKVMPAVTPVLQKQEVQVSLKKRKTPVIPENKEKPVQKKPVLRMRVRAGKHVKGQEM